ncbi:MAG: hypothetical protein R3E08_12710 [Thiotrichaceae bacterium]
MKEVGCILIVDNTQGTLGALLARDHYQLLFATHTSEAFEQAVRHTPDLILLEAKTALLTQFDLCQRVRHYPKLAETPIVLLMEQRDSILIQQALDAGVDDLLLNRMMKLKYWHEYALARLNHYHQVLSEWSRFEWVVEQTEDGYLC